MKEKEDKGKNTNSLEDSSPLIKPEVQEPTTERELPEVVAEADSYPEVIAIALEGFGNIPWVVKPIYGFASDSIPLFGYRRRSYSILCGLLSSTAWCLLGTNISSITGVLITLVSAELGTAFSDVVVDSIVVERVRGKPQETAASLQVICWASRAVGGIISAYYSGYIVDHFGPRVVSRTVACFPSLITISSFLVKERKLHDPLTPVKQLQSSSGVSRFSNKITSVLWTQSKPLWSAFSQRRIYLPALFMFLYQVAPNVSSAMFFYETNELHFTPEFMGKVALIGQIASLLGVGVFNFFLKSVALKKVFAWSCILTTIIGSSQFILISRINREYGLSDQLFVLGDSVILNALGQVAFMPGLVLAARICPEGVEATLFALIMSIYNGGAVASSSMGAWLTNILGVTKDDFTNLAPLISICLLSNLFPLAFLGLLPEDLEDEKAE
eukprot:g834.t1